MLTLQNLFVNREKQTAGFVKIVEGGTPKRVMLIEAPGGFGKSWTVEYMRAECVKRSLPHVIIDFADGVVYDFLAVLRRARDSFGAGPFNAFTQTINEVTQPTIRLETSAASNAVVNLAQNSTIADSNVTVEAGTIIKDNSFVINADSAVIRQAIQDRLTTSFFECLDSLTALSPVCFFFDTYDKASGEAENWLLTQLLPRMREGKLTNVIVVTAGRSAPKLDSLWDGIVARTGLDPLKAEHVSEYLIQRCGLQNIDQNVVTALFQASTGQPSLLAMMAENLRNAQAKEGQNDWL
ncbi:MAG TPA: hypothetical protein VGE07_26840 [Herpetosiphonaceae bacterium]